MPGDLSRHMDISEIRHPSGSSFRTIPQLGAHLFELDLKFKGNAIPVFGRFENQVNYKIYYEKYFHGSKLFPYTNRINGSKYTWNGKHYHIDSGKTDSSNALHGLVHSSTFTRKTFSNPSEMEFSYQMHPDDHPGYPFEVKCEILYSLGPDFLRVETRINNLSDSRIPAGDGWHPYFFFPRGIDQVDLELPEVELLELDQNSIPTGIRKKIDEFAKPRPLKNRFLDHSFFISEKNSPARTFLIDKSADYRVVIEQDNYAGSYNFLQVYTHPIRQFIAIEPMSCAPDAFNNKMGLNVMEAGEIISRSFTIRIEA